MWKKRSVYKISPFFLDFLFIVLAYCKRVVIAKALQKPALRRFELRIMSIRYYGTTDAGSEDEESEQSLLGARYSTRDCEDEELSQFGSMYSRSVDSMDGDSVLDGSRARIYNKRKRSRSSQILAAGLFLVMALSSIAYTSRAVSFLYRESSGESVVREQYPSFA